MDTAHDRRTWQRLVLTLDPDQSAALRALAQANYRHVKQEALRLLADGLERETRARQDAAK